MKRQVETALEWKFGNGEPLTNLPAPVSQSDGTPKMATPRIVEIGVTSFRNSTEGDIYIEFDQHFGSGYWGNCPMESALSKLSQTCYLERLGGEGGSGMGPKFWSTHFLLTRQENSFCRGAISRVIGILKHLGVEKDQLPCPKVTQQTHVWVPKDKGWKSWAGIEVYGWVEFGRLIGHEHGLNDKLFNG